MAEDHTTLLLLSRFCRHGHQVTECFQEGSILLVHQHLIQKYHFTAISPPFSLKSPQLEPLTSLQSHLWRSWPQRPGGSSASSTTSGRLKIILWQLTLSQSEREEKVNTYLQRSSFQNWCESCCNFFLYKASLTAQSIQHNILSFSNISNLLFHTLDILILSIFYLKMFLLGVIEVFVILIDKYQSISHILHKLGVFGNFPPTVLSEQNLHNYNYNSTSWSLI